METVPQRPLGAGKLSRGEASQPETAVAQRQVLGAGVMVLMTVGKRVDRVFGERGWARNHRAKGLSELVCVHS